MPKHPLPIIPISLAFLLPAVSSAASYTLMAPLGPLSGPVTLSQYLDGIFKLTIGIAGVLAVVMLVICGIKVISSGSVSGKTAAKECLWNALFGMLIAIGAYALLNTINPLLLSNAITVAEAPSGTAGAGAGATTEPTPTKQGCFFQYKEVSTGNTKYGKAGNQYTCEQLRSNFQANTGVNVLGSCSCNTQSSAGTPTATTPPPASSVSGSVNCGTQSGLNLCDGQLRQCTNPNCAQFASMAASAASTVGGPVTANLLKAMILQESSCGQQLVGDGGQSCGPIQIKPGTANKYLATCGLTTPVTCGWLANKANWDKAICLSAAYLKAVSGTTCGSTVRNMAAGYNGGPGVCAPSADCSGDTNCAGTTVQQWECLYDDAAHTQCNVGFNTTRNYATRVSYCEQHPGY